MICYFVGKINDNVRLLEIAHIILLPVLIVEAIVLTVELICDVKNALKKNK